MADHISEKPHLSRWQRSVAAVMGGPGDLNPRFEPAELVGDWRGGGHLYLEENGAFTYVGRSHPEMCAGGTWVKQDDGDVRLAPSGSEPFVYHVATRGPVFFFVSPGDPDDMSVFFTRHQP